MIRFFLGALLALTTLAAHAAYDCFPSTWVPVPGLGTPYRTTTQPYGETKAWWCQLPSRQGDLAGKLYWNPQYFPVHNTDRNLTAFGDALTRVAAATDKIRQANIEVQLGSVPIVPGSQKAYEYEMLRYTACKDLQVPANWPVGVVFDRPAVVDPAAPSVYDASWCGQPPVAPPAAAAWVTSGTSSYNTRNGALSSYAGSIAKGLACDDTVPVIRVGTTVYKHFAGAAVTVVAACISRP